MAETLTKAELDKARAELRRVNEQHFGRAPQDKGPGQPAPEEPAPAGNSQAVGEDRSVPDPGPARFIGIDLDRKLVGLSGGGVIPIDDTAYGKIVDILLGQLQISLTRSLRTVAESHKHAGALEQLEIPFEENHGGDPA
jgi:hypothetical protein